MMREPPLFIIMNETVWSSWLKDGMTIGLLLALVVVNHTIGQGATSVDTFGVFCLVLYFLAAATMARRKRAFTREELRAWALTEPSPPVEHPIPMATPDRLIEAVARAAVGPKPYGYCGGLTEKARYHVEVIIPALCHVLGITMNDLLSLQTRRRNA